MNNIYSFCNKNKICIICEGNEEYKYLQKIKELKVLNEKYDIDLVNAGGNGNIAPRYQDKYQNASYDIVLVFCDTEKKPYEQYEDIKNKINAFHDVHTAAENVIIFANPCTMQLIIKHFDDVKLKTQAKKVNAPIIKYWTGIENYKGREDQIDDLMQQITKDNFEEMHARVNNLSLDDTIKGSSNFSKFLGFFMGENDDWIADINKELDGCT